MPKRVAIIGAGCSGLAAIKCCLEAELEPVCFESSADVGGLWRFTEEVKDVRGCVMESTVINTSKEMMSFSDFPAPRDFPNFMHHSKVLEYFQRYADRFDLLKFIKFNHEVISVTQHPSQDRASQQDSCSVGKDTAEEADSPIKESRDERDTPRTWKLTVSDSLTKLTSDHSFDFVLICTGHHAEPNVPYFPGQGIFEGKIIHSRDFRKASDVTGSRHLVVGIGNSGCDIAVELSRRGQVFLSSRRGTWLMQRLQHRGLPADVSFMSRLVFSTALSLPYWLLDYLAAWSLNKQIDHKLYGLCPQHGPFATHPTVNDELPNRIAAGQVIIKPNIDSFTSNGVRFDDGSTEDDLNSVILATGYRVCFPFLDRSVLKVKGNHLDLYKYMFPPSLCPPTLAVIGCVQPTGALAPISEMQCRLAVKVFKGEVTLPNQKAMLLEIESKRRSMAKRYVKSQRHTFQVDYIPYMDELARLIGCLPRWGRLLLSDPRLALTCVFGPCTAYQFRLYGPNSWPGAREAILHQMERVRWPFNPRHGDQQQETDVNVIILSLLLLSLACCILFVFVP
nr:dimethylaniline monooxygenase [N-oxide-forming] 5-like isoform X1 [Biomphalaria glabrata]